MLKPLIAKQFKLFFIKFQKRATHPRNISFWRFLWGCCAIDFSILDRWLQVPISLVVSRSGRYQCGYFSKLKSNIVSNQFGFPAIGEKLAASNGVNLHKVSNQFGFPAIGELTRLKIASLFLPFPINLVSPRSGRASLGSLAA
jgi:hypothetical protein